MLSFASAPGNLFNRLGKLGLLIKQMRTYQASQLTNLTDTTNGVVAQYNGEPDIQALIGSSYIGILNSPGSIGAFAQNIAQTTLNRMIFRDNPRIAQNLQSLQVNLSIKELIRQMKVAGATVLAQTITTTPSVWTGVGNGTTNIGTRRPLDGLVLENTFAENMLLQCTRDSYTGGAIPGNESFQITGVGSEQNLFAFDWPLGSNVRAQLNAINGNANNSQGNLLTNSGFEKWTKITNVPDNFSLDVGGAGVNVNQETSINYDGVASLRITGDGAGTLTRLRQQFGATTGTQGSLSPLTQYSINVYIRRDAVAPAAGELTIELVDGGGTIIQDMAGRLNTFAIDLTGLTTVYTGINNRFRTPEILPSSAYLQIRLSIALTNGRSVYLDKCSFGPMTQVGVSEPFVAVHAGSIPYSVGGVQPDFATITVTNSRGAAGTLSTMQTLMSQLFPQMISSEFLLPSSSVPTISDGLIA